MANSERGEVSFIAAGKTYVMRLDMNAIIAIQQKTGLKLAEVFAQLQPGEFDPVATRVVVWAMLGGDEAMPIEDAGRIVPNGGFPELTTKMQQAIEVAFPSLGGAQENPPAASRKAG